MPVVNVSVCAVQSLPHSVTHKMLSQKELELRNQLLFLVGFPSSPSLSFPEPLLSWPGIVPAVLAHLLRSLVLWVSSGSGCSESLLLYHLPIVFGFCNLIFGASVKTFKPFVMVAIPLQLHFLLGMGSDA